MPSFLSSNLHPQPGLYKASCCIRRIFSLCCKMGRKPSPEEIYKRAQANGYVYTAHHEEDSQQVDTSYVAKTIKDQKSVLNRYKT